MKNKTSKPGLAVGGYFKYAIGEVLLVVVGILIALQINNANEIRKGNVKKREYINSIIQDLKKDSAFIQKKNSIMQKDLDEIIEFSKRLSKSTATIDTILKIYNFEFTGRFDISNTFFDNTFKTIISTGDLTLFDLNFRNGLMEHYQIQDIVIEGIRENIDLFMDSFKKLDLPPKRRNGINGRDSFGIKGKLLERIHKMHSDDDILIEFNKFLTSKAIMEENIIYYREHMLTVTTKYLQILYKI